MSNTSLQALREAQMAFAGAAEAMGIYSEEDIQILVDDVRFGRKNKCGF